MSSQMLSKFSLRFNDSDLNLIYKREKTEFFQKALPIVSSMLGLLAIILEVMYRAMGMGELPQFVTMVNFIFLGLLLFITCLHSRFNFLHLLICPLLTVINFMYISFVDYDYTVGSIYYS